MSEHVAYTMSATCTLGGIIGYVNSGSRISFIAGASFGALYFLSAQLISNYHKNGYDVAAATSILLAASMIPRALKNFRPVPTTLSILGSATAFYYIKKAVEFRNSA
ncbi:hypothetical protein BB560_002184 [Smittium megazygosporum]|uniref:Transmembrane protein 14 n=1 Tax=Smittium megazygosporum TaxID=133381 RepID=A0A2T9ZFG6_9FUNG|nr:hypothetical protein BB560_002184 [Smittium megazygosporum]